MYKLIVLLVITGTMLGQTPAAKPQTTATLRKPAVAAKSGVDMVIELVTNGMSEALVIKQLQREGKAYTVTTPDLLKLQKAGVSENIINVMMDPKTTVLAHADQPPTPVGSPSSKDPTPGGAALAPAPPPPATADTASVPGAATPYPPDLPNMPTARKRRVVVAAFDFGAMKDQVQAIYSPWSFLNPRAGVSVSNQNVTDEIGRGIQAMLMTRLQQSNTVTVLDRNDIITIEQKRGVGSGADLGTSPKPRILGADCVVTGDITIFGRDDKTRQIGGAGGAGGGLGIAIGALRKKKKEEKAVVAISFRVVDAETSEILATASATGKSIRTSTEGDFGGLGLGRGAAAGGGLSLGTTNSNFEKTIMGEATVDAVNQIAKQLEEKIPQLPAKPRSIQGRLAAITDGGAYLALSSNDGVQLGDRFEVRQINNEVFDPQTKESIALEAVKVGELVVKEVDNKSSLGDYGGQPLNPANITGKGYQVRLMNR